VDAIVENLKYARSQELTPITASQYAAIANGFHSARITGLQHRMWRIDDRGGLDTVRFDHADSDWVDWADSHGVVGQRHVQGSLYLALDSADRAPVIALATSGRQLAGTRPYLIESRWRISNFCAETGRFEFEARGFGTGEMEWQAIPNAGYEVRVYRIARLIETLRGKANQEGRLQFAITQKAMDPVRVQVILSGSTK
jgi:hypothetical protein